MKHAGTRRVVLLAAASVGAAIVGLLGCRQGGSDLVIGGVLPLTGDAGTFGKNAARGAELAIEQANSQQRLPGRKIIWKAEDSRGAAAEAISAARKLVDIDSASLLIGDVTSAGTHALLPFITERKIPTISPAASDPALSGKSRYFARVWPSDVYEARVVAGHAAKEGYSRIGVIYASTDYGVAMADEFRKLAKDRIKAEIAVNRETLNYRPSIERLRIERADSIFFVLYPEDGGRLLTQLDEQGLDLPLLATATFEDPKLLGLPGAGRVVFASPRPPTENDSVRKAFVTAYKARFGEDPGVLSDTGYDAARILIEAFSRGSAEGAEGVMRAVLSLRDFPGASGLMTFDQNGDVEKTYALRTVVNGKFDWFPSAGSGGV